MAARARDLPVRLTPPDWLVRTVKPKPAPIPWPAVLRAGVALAVPLAVGLAVGEPTKGALVSIGAIAGVIGDTAEAYRMRLLNIAVPQLLGALGVTLGSLVHGHGWTAVVVLMAIALVSGMVSTIGAVASSAGLLLLLNAVIGAGLPLPGPWWEAPLLLSAGGLFVLLLSLLLWPWRGGTAERETIAGSFWAVADLLEGAGLGPSEWDARRQRVTDSLNAAYDLILARRAGSHGRSEEQVRQLTALNALVPLVEAAIAVHSGMSAPLPGCGPIPSDIPAYVRKLAEAVGSGSHPAELAKATAMFHVKHDGAVGDGTGSPVADSPVSGSPVSGKPVPDGPANRAVEQALRHVTEVLGEQPGTPPARFDDRLDRLGRPAALGIRLRRATRDLLLTSHSWRYGLRLALCIGLAQILVSLIDVPRSYWVALTVTFVLKPDFGSVFSRAVLRALGTAAGLVVAAAVLEAVPTGWAVVPIIAVLGALIPAVSARSYGYQTAAITPVMLMLSDQLSHLGFDLVLPRLVDSLIGCGIALVAGYLLWPESWHTRIGSRLAGAVEEAANYLDHAFDDSAGRARETRAEVAARARARRRLYRDLSAVRTEFQRALTEPPPTGRLAAAWWPLVVAVERIVDATTAARVRVNHGAPPPKPAEVTALGVELRELAEGVRTEEVPYSVTSRLPQDTEGVLAPVRREVHAARAVSAPRRG